MVLSAHPLASRGGQASGARHHSTLFLTQATSLRVALLILNVEHGPSAVSFAHLWDQSTLRLCADGAANRLYDSLDETTRRSMLPDVISGDLDSIRPEVSDFYSAAGVEIAGKPEQETNDFEKCLSWLQQRCGAASIGPTP